MLDAYLAAGAIFLFVLLVYALTVALTPADIAVRRWNAERKAERKERRRLENELTKAKIAALNRMHRD